MSWGKICAACRHAKEFDPLLDECPREHDPGECLKKQVGNLTEMGGIEAAKPGTPKKRRRGRPAPLPEPKPYYTHGDKYPDSVRICFEDGHTEIYDRRISQPSPAGYVNNSRRGKP